MSKGSDLDRVSAIVLREMRPPLVVLVSVYAVGIGVMMLIPGRDGDPMSAFHAFYFMTYTATTTGFGELPQAFSDSQRLWAMICLYMSVLAWIYGIGTIFRLVQNPHFTLALSQSRFARAVQRVNGPFYVICGFGDTGSLLARGLSDQCMNAVIIDTDPERLKALAMRDYAVSMPGLQGDASVPKNLTDAGVTREECRAVVLLTGDEDVNFKIAVMVRLLNPQADVICRSTAHKHDEELRGLGQITLVDPFQVWSRELGLALRLPELHTLDEWLVGAHGVTLEKLIAYPQGTWIVCGFGHLGKSLYRVLRERAITTVVIDPNLDGSEGIANSVAGLATRANLRQAGVDTAAGVIAATNSDTDNLAILLTARSMNKHVHVVVRQNRHENEMAFSAAQADLIMQPSLVTARHLLLRLISPMIEELLEFLEANPERLRNELLPRLRATAPAVNPALWTVALDAEATPAVIELIESGHAPALKDLLRDPADRDTTLPCVPLLMQRGTQRTFIPATDILVEPGDRLLLLSSRTTQIQIRASLSHPYTLAYLQQGIRPPRGFVFRRIRAR